jgi:hypothetical protein
MKKITHSFNVLAVIIAVTILQACASTAGKMATQCAKPKLTPQIASGKAGTSIPVRVETETTGAHLRYTLDGSAPTGGNATVIPAQSRTVLVPLPDVFGRTLKLQAIAVKPGLTNSLTAVGYYTASY